MMRRGFGEGKLCSTYEGADLT